jgi:hypothetical protein
MPKVLGNQIPLPWFEIKGGGAAPPPVEFFIIPEDNATYPYIAQEVGLTDLMKRESAP